LILFTKKHGGTRIKNETKNRLKFAIIRTFITFLTLAIVTVVITELYSDTLEYSIVVGLPSGFVVAFIVYMYLAIRKQKPTKTRTIQIIAMTSFMLCLGILLVYHWFTKQTTELDIPSHFFGGVTVSALVSLIYETVPSFSFLEGNKFHALVVVVIGFEFFEYIFLAHIIPDLEYVPTVTQPFDTITDIIAGLIGGAIFMYWEVKKWTLKKV
jgi:hypothetical protein